MSTPFSLLLPVYRGDRADHLARSFQSTVHEQVRRPSEVVVVQDGHVGPELASALERLESASPVPVRRLRLKHNVGLAQALQCGLSACSHEVVARMDADDISLPHRFAVQLPLVEAGADLVGAGMREFGESTPVGGLLRVPPTDPAEIAAEARLRSPFNHPTVVYRRSAVLQAGGYRELPLLEDYWLFTRMIESGSVVANVPEPLVLYRVDAGSYQRRGGLRLLRSELGLQRRLRAESFTSRAQMARNIAVRGGYRVIPVGLRKSLYRNRFTIEAGTLGETVEREAGPLGHRQDTQSCTRPEPRLDTRPGAGRELA
ncbi:glycosyltransferase [Pedococcus sp. 2YAF34]|uniref:glycosyltransferase n=1 Tax=Pedococcus sp. 2YAF34 TaxID=3233032 RepID=UPI003F9BBE94